MNNLEWFSNEVSKIQMAIYKDNNIPTYFIIDYDVPTSAGYVNASIVYGELK